jgi:hypothetical protein
MIAGGGLMIVPALFCLAAAMGGQSDTNVLSVAGAFFSSGMLIISTGVYFKARVLQTDRKGESATTNRRVRGGCDLCAGETPVVQCKVHQLHLCANCLVIHYDFRSCAYAPTTRRATARATKTMGRARGVHA